MTRERFSSRTIATILHHPSFYPHRACKFLAFAALLTPTTVISYMLNPRQLTPSAEALLHSLHQTSWHRDLQAAEAIVAQRRRHLHRNRKRQREHGGAQQHERSLQDQTAPESILTLSQSSSQTCLSPLQRWFVSNIDSIDSSTWESIQYYNVTTLAYFYKHYVSRADGSEEYFGSYGERTNEMKENHQRMISFWSEAEKTQVSFSKANESATNALQDLLNTNAAYQYVDQTSPNLSGGPGNVALLGMHGVDLKDNGKLIPTLQQLYSLDATTASAMAMEIQSTIQLLPGAYNNPLLTANALATQSSISDGSNHERDSVIVGDGVFTFLEWLELGPDGPDYIHAHEFGHHIQYDMGIERIELGSTLALESRRLELMADVFGSYYMAHKDGEGMDAERLYQVHRAAFSLGDCELTEGTHHGTPRQRECASNYGANLALASYIDGGYIIPPVKLREMFEDKYDLILALDENECQPIVDKSTLDNTIYGEDYGVNATLDSGTVYNNSSKSSDAAVTSLEPNLLWFEQKPVDYAAPSEESSFTASSPQDVQYEPTSSSSWQDDWYANTQTYNHSTEDGNSISNNPLNEPVQLIENAENKTKIENAQDDWFAETQWNQVRTASSSSNILRSCIGHGLTIMMLILYYSERSDYL